MAAATSWNGSLSGGNCELVTRAGKATPTSAPRAPSKEALQRTTTAIVIAAAMVEFARIAWTHILLHRSHTGKVSAPLHPVDSSAVAGPGGGSGWNICAQSPLAVQVQLCRAATSLSRSAKRPAPGPPLYQRTLPTPRRPPPGVSTNPSIAESRNSPERLGESAHD